MQINSYYVTYSLKELFEGIEKLNDLPQITQSISDNQVFLTPRPVFYSNTMLSYTYYVCNVCLNIHLMNLCACLKRPLIE